MRLRSTKVLSSLTASVLLLAAGGCSNWSAEGQVEAAVDKYVQAIRAEDTGSAAKSCTPDMTWTYYVAPAKTSVLRGAAARAGFPESIRKIQGRDGCEIDITGVTVVNSTATVQASVCIPVCYDRMALQFGKITIPVRLSLVQRNGVWALAAIEERSQRVEAR